MQYARRQRAKGRRPLINSAALPGQKAARTVLPSQPPARRSTIEITALLGAFSNPREPARAAEAWPPKARPRTRGWAAESERASPVVVSAAQPKWPRGASGISAPPLWPLQPAWQAIERDDLIDLHAWTHQRPLRVAHQHLGHERARVVGAGLHRPVGARCHHGQEIARLRLAE